MDSLRRLEARNRQTTLTLLSRHGGRKAPDTHRYLTNTIAWVDGAASCYWGCARGDHVYEYIVGKGCSAARASLLLTESAYYDEALTATRTVGEIVNLLFLFAVRPSAVVEWLAAPEEKRGQRYGPIKVRLAIEAVGAPVPIDKDRYGALSGIGPHVTRDHAPQRFNPAGRPTLGAFVQVAGIVVCINELGYATALLGLLAAKHLSLPAAVERDGLQIAKSLYNSLGSIEASSINEVLAGLGRSDNSPAAG